MRLPRKVLKKISGRRMVEHIVDRMKAVPSLDDIYIATSSHPDDQILLSIAEKNNIKGYPGSELSVIDRLMHIATKEDADYIVRVTGDNIYSDSNLLELLISKAKETEADYARVEGAPIGVTAEVMKVTALKDCFKRIEPELSEYLMLYMFDPDKYRTLIIDVSGWVPPCTTLTVDTPEDWNRTIFIEKSHDDGSLVSLNDVVELYKAKGIPNFQLRKDAEVKLPHENYVTLEDFIERQRKLVEKAQVLITLGQEEYLNA